MALDQPEEQKEKEVFERLGPPLPQKKKSKLAELVEFVKEGTGQYREIVLGLVANHQAQNINQQTGVKINGSKKIVSSTGITHALKRHGDNIEETARGQKGVTDADFELIPQILSSPDNVIYGGKNNRGKDSLVFVRKLGKLVYHVVMSVDPNRGKPNISFSTMYIKR